MKIVKVNYRKHWSKTGACYTQTIKIDKDFQKYIIRQIKYLKDFNRIKRNRNTILKFI